MSATLSEAPEVYERLAQRPITQWLARSGPWTLVVYALAVSFSTYFCMYGFRKPFAGAQFQYDHIRILGLELKTAYVISQILGYTASKYIGIKLCSEASRARRLFVLIALILWAEIALLGFAILPPSLGVMALFLNGLSLGMVWGFVVRYLEGRSISDILLAGLCGSFIVSSGATKDVGRWLMTAHEVSEFWMPFVTGLCFLPLFLLSAWLLDQIPEPSAEDKASRCDRPPMHKKERQAFVKKFLPGLVMLFIVYLFLTAYRDYRDNYAVDILAELGLEETSWNFSQIEVPVAVVVLGLLSLMYLIKDHRVAMKAIFLMMGLGSGIIGLGTLAMDQGLIGGVGWMFLVGVGAYLAYVPYNAVLFDRLVASTHSVGNAVFAIYIADALGYSGSVATQMYQDILVSEVSRLNFFRIFSYLFSVGGVIAFGASSIYFMARSPKGPVENLGKPTK